MSQFIDRRLNPKNKSAVNRQRFLQRFRGQIRKAVADAVAKRSVTDVERGEEDSDSDQGYFGTDFSARAWRAAGSRSTRQQGVHRRR